MELNGKLDFTGVIYLRLLIKYRAHSLILLYPIRRILKKMNLINYRRNCNPNRG